MGLHIDIDRIQQENAGKTGYRKGGLLVNRGDILTKEEKVALQRENKRIYGLPREYYESLRLPESSNIKIYNVDRIVRGRKKFTIPEKLQHLAHIKTALMQRLEVVRDGKIIANFQNQTYADYQRLRTPGCMTAEQARREMEGSYEGSDVDEEDEMGRGEVIHRHQNQTRYNPMNSVLEVRSSQRTIESADEQPAKKPTPKRLSSAKIAAIFKNKYDTTEDPRRLPKHKRGPHSLRRKRVQAEPEPVYSEDEFRPEALPKADRKSKVIETEKKLTRYQRKMLEPADSQESHESQASSEKQPKVEQQTVPKKRTTKQAQKAKPQPVKQLPVPQPQVKKFVWVNPYLIQINKADLLSSQELHKLDASTKPAPTVDKKVSQVSQAERS